MTRVHSETKCTLGEGAFWHPKRNQFFWFDILGKSLRTVVEGAEQHWQFDECVSAAGWIDHDTILIASQTGLWRFNLETAARDLITPLEADNPVTRSNDGRADPQGGFWIGTMGFNAEKGAGSIYRFYRGELRKLFSDITITNSICFAPDGKTAYFTDTVVGVIMAQALDADGWPIGDAVPFIDVSDADFGADGSVVDADGNLWNAQWGAGRVACYGADGTLIKTVDVPTPQTSCPAFGGADLTDLYVTTAAEGIDDPNAGKTYVISSVGKGQTEHQIIL